MPADRQAMALFRWIVAAVLLFGLFTGIAYVLVPVLTDGWGNELSFAVGVALIVCCGAALFHFDPRQG